MTGKEILRQHLHGYSDEQFEDDIKHFPLSECLCALERVIVANQSDLTEVRAALEVATACINDIKFICSNYDLAPAGKVRMAISTALSQIDKLNKD